MTSHSLHRSLLLIGRIPLASLSLVMQGYHLVLLWTHMSYVYLLNIFVIQAG